MPRARRQSRPSARTPVNNIPNTRTMGNEKLRAFIHDMDTPDDFRAALAEHLGIPSVRSRLQPPRLDVIGQRVGNIAQRRKDMVPIGTRYATPTSLSFPFCLFNLRLKVLTYFLGQILAGRFAALGMDGPTTRLRIFDDSCTHRFTHYLYRLDPFMLVPLFSSRRYLCGPGPGNVFGRLSP